MGFPEYLAARESLAIIGKPVITYILIISLLQGILSFLYIIKRKNVYYDYLIKFIYINTGLYVLGFIFLIRFHIQIYNTVLIEYPAVLRQLIPVDSSRFIIPLWIESEKLYFWAMVAFIFVLVMQRRKDIIAFIGIILSIFSTLIFFLSNPFKEPLPAVHSEITMWYSALGREMGRFSR